MQTITIKQISEKHCPYTLHGENIATFRRVRLHKIAKALEVDSDTSKNELLGKIMAKLKTMNASNELSDLK